MSRRAMHVMKSPEEYREYLDTTIRVTDTSTTARLEAAGATDQPSPADVEAAGPVQAHAMRAAWLQTHWQGVVAGGIATLLVGVLSWLAVTLIGLYREDGVTAAKLEAVDKRQTELSHAMDRLEDRMARDMDALRQRMDQYLAPSSPRVDSGSGG